MVIPARLPIGKLELEVLRATLTRICISIDSLIKMPPITITGRFIRSSFPRRATHFNPSCLLHHITLPSLQITFLLSIISPLTLRSKAPGSHPSLFASTVLLPTHPPLNT
ncbi:hypothetical protein PCANC_14614 [Puccinia coronata f. sp. avenae]|uniref:Uncharacterized protein n=1 Tax=Puccinia coronata f. sp. avenae TaxID=200324 RepID=A0A2N5SV50_9BASI|nr:hypothetical protein PCANC_14614 [Puccinia coronata f. sp. avenae]PLW45586.1 hypothetical protein PCASD_06256 [Puccinia coronata f. sp. avenae]